MSITGLPFAPKVLLLQWVGATADGSVADAMTGHGVACDAGSTTQHAATVVSDDNNTDSLFASMATATDCVLILNAAGTVVGRADVSSWTSDGAVLNWTNCDGTQRLVTYTALSTPGISLAHQRPTSTGSVGYTGAGFTPTGVIIIGAAPDNTSLDSNGSIRAGITLGWGTSSAQGLCGWGGRSSRTTGDGQSYQRSNLIVAALLNFVDSEASLTSLDADGCTLNWTTVSTRASYFIVVYLSGIDMAVGATTVDTDTGADATTGTGFQPELVLLQSWGRAPSTSITAEAWYSFGAATSSSARYVLWAGDDNGVATTGAQSYLDRDEVLVYLTPGAGGGSPTLTAEADFSSMDADGFTIDFSDAAPSAHQLLWCCIRTAGATRRTRARFPLGLHHGINQGVGLIRRNG